MFFNSISNNSSIIELGQASTLTLGAVGVWTETRLPSGGRGI